MLRTRRNLTLWTDTELNRDVGWRETWRHKEESLVAHAPRDHKIVVYLLSATPLTSVMKEPQRTGFRYLRCPSSALSIPGTEMGIPSILVAIRSNPIDRLQQLRNMGDHTHLLFMQ